MISVIIPTLNEERSLAACIETVLREGIPVEIILSDGGSVDSTLKIAQRFKGVRIVRSERGRGVQMNRGASQAKGEVLLFLHADTILEKGWGEEMRAALRDRLVVGGAFSFRIANPKPRYRIIEAWVRMRCGLFRLPYGDQAIFVRSTVFRELGGYSEIPLMEDVDLVGRMKRCGRISILPAHAVTSDRRWERKGWLSVALVNQAIMALYRLGVDPRVLGRWYYR